MALLNSIKYTTNDLVKYLFKNNGRLETRKKFLFKSAYNLVSYKLLLFLIIFLRDPLIR